MAVIILNNESIASNRCVPLWCVQSNGTSAATNESGRTFMFEIGGVFYGSGGSISPVSPVGGLYTCIFSASKISVTGVGPVMYSSSTALRSEERRVGKEGRSRGAPYYLKKKKTEEENTPHRVDTNI